MLEFVLKVLLETMFYATGHFVLWVVTFGRWKFLTPIPTEDGSTSIAKKPSGWPDRDDAAVLVGILFWGLIGVAIWLVFFR